MADGFSRRGFLGTAAAFGALPAVARAGAGRTELRAAPGVQVLGPEGSKPANIWGYGGAVPGPILRVRQGERLRARLINGLDQPTTVHWHGIRIDNTMDGVAHLTQAPVPPGGSFDYEFAAPDAGTYWYHPHSRSWEQLARGLYGVLIVDEPEPPQVDRDMALVIDDWQLGQGGVFDEERLGNAHDWSHAGALGNWPTVNGQAQPRLPARLNERLRLRLINVANATVLYAGLEGMAARLIALDGQPIAPRPLSDVIPLAPGARADVIADVISAEGVRLMLGGRENFELATFVVSGKAREEPLGDAAPLPANPLTELREGGEPLDVRLVMEGGAMRWLETARIGEMAAMHGEIAPVAGAVSGRDLAGQGLFWAMNGVAGMPEKPLFSVKKGASVQLTFENRTAFAHAMHLHGHHVFDAAEDAWRDTVLVARDGPRAAVTVRFVADNPGRWMLHCHMLEHQVAGMATWFEVL